VRDQVTLSRLLLIFSISINNWTANTKAESLAPEFVSSNPNTSGGQATIEFAMEYS